MHLCFISLTFIQYIIRGKMAFMECFSMLSPVFCWTSKSIWRNKVNIEINVIDDITIMLTLVKLLSGYYYSQQHGLNTNIASL